jgi:hypothetical protein
MKITDIAILFVIIVLPFVQMLRIKSDNLQNIAYKNMVIDRYLDTAVVDASEAMIIRGIKRQTVISRDNGLNAFFRTLFANFKILDNDSAKNKLMVYIPVVIVVDYDGYWVWSIEEYANGDGEKEQQMVWKPKKPYTYESNDFVYTFTLDSYVKVLDLASNEFYEGYRQDLETILPGVIIQQDEVFEAVRKKAIIEALKKDVNIAINTHNIYAKRFGITYRFSPPSISDGDWYRNIEDVGFLAFFQGIPIGLGGEHYNSFSLGAARIVRNDYYYIQQNNNGLFYYHRQNCTELTNKDEVFDSREECAMKGAFPCRSCRP